LPKTSQEKSKAKTRGESDQRDDSALENVVLTDGSATPEEERIKVAVSKQALWVFESMFLGRNLEARYRYVDWKDFVKAMGEGEVDL
jgi:hypothetical protein